jgi:uncharacterized protein YcfJ
MRLVFLAPLAVVLAGCAHDNYSVVAGGPGSQDRMNAELKACKQQAIDAYFDSEKQQPHTGAAVGAVFGGAVGSALGAMADKSGENPKAMQTSDIDPMIEHCMADRGYSGTSEN